MSRLVTLIFLFIGSFTIGCAGSQDVPSEFAVHRSQVDRILKYMTSNHRAYKLLATLCDGIGHRLSGSPQLEEANDWAVEVLKAEGHVNVRKEKVMVPKWVRGKESVTLTAPRQMPLAMLGLGGSVGTPPEGLKAQVLVVKDEAGLKALGDKVKGKIVLFNNPMPQWSPTKGSGYGNTVRFRVHGANMAVSQGAVAILVRSVTAQSLYTPHTGTLWYGNTSKKIPAAAITTEDADLLQRFYSAGKTVAVHLKMEARTEGMAPSANVIAELKGREKPEEIVIISGHMDSWDVGQGAHDDGAGVVMAMEGLNALKKLGIRPRRTIRVVLWTNEENGTMGARTYVKDHAKELRHHVAAIESDSGGFNPSAFGVALKDKKKQAVAATQMRAIMAMLKSVGTIVVKPGHSAADVGKLVKHGVPGIGLYTHGAKYFHTHHTAADTLDKVNPDELARSAAAMTALAYVLAEMPYRLGETGP
jgi:carboxypeptidase Q